MNKTFSEVSKLLTFKSRYDYLKLTGSVGESTFGFDRYLNQLLYKSSEWKRIRDFVIVRDNGCDLGMDGYDIRDRIIVHHMNPINVEDVERRNPKIYNPEFLICVSHITHQAIHYSDESLLPKKPLVRFANDTCPWRQ